MATSKENGEFLDAIFNVISATVDMLKANGQPTTKSNIAGNITMMVASMLDDMVSKQKKEQ